MAHYSLVHLLTRITELPDPQEFKKDLGPYDVGVDARDFSGIEQPLTKELLSAFQGSESYADEFVSHSVFIYGNVMYLSVILRQKD